jgi:hypothetical protein
VRRPERQDLAIERTGKLHRQGGQNLIEPGCLVRAVSAAGGSWVMARSYAAV